MSREKKSQVDDITKLRKILDNPSDPGTEKLISDDEKALHSIRRQLVGRTSRTSQKPAYFLRKFDSLEPKVTVHPKIPVSPLSTTSLPSFQLIPAQPTAFQATTPLPEFKLVSASVSERIPPQPEVSFASEELYEVEKVEARTPAFSEGTPNESPEKPSATTMTQVTPSVLDTNLPEWQPVDDTYLPEPHVKKSMNNAVEEQQINTRIDSPRADTSTQDTIPEFERLEPSPSETAEKQAQWEMIRTDRQPREEAVKIQSMESSEVPAQTLTRKQLREAKKAEKRKEKEVKKQKKLELKKLKMEAMEKEREARRLALEQQIASPTPITPPIQPVELSEEKSEPVKIDTSAFNDMETIDEKTAELLYKNGYFSLDALKDATVDDLVQIHGIKRTLAKQIKKELQQKISAPLKSEFVPLKEKTHRVKPKKTSDDSTEWESYHTEDDSEPSIPVDVCVYHGYTLYRHVSHKERGKKTTLHFFSKEKPEVGDPISLPAGYRIAVNKKTGVPYLKKKK
jgi:hypothetical protein